MSPGFPLGFFLTLCFPVLAGAQTLKDLRIPGTPEFVAAAKDIVDARVSIKPSIASNAGLFDDGVRVPSYSAAAVAALAKRLDADLARLRAMPWRSWDVDRQIDWRWMYANAELAKRELTVEKMYLRRPAAWLEPFADNMIALLTYAPERVDLRKKLVGMIPGMVAEMRQVVVAPTARDVKMAEGVSSGIAAMLKAEPAGAERDAALSSLTRYIDDLRALKDLTEFVAIGRENHDWRLRRALLLPWTSQQLLAMAQRELAEADAALEELKPRVSTWTAPTDAQRELARSLTQESLLALYDEVVREDREFLERSSMLTVPAGVGPIRSRPTPEPMIPLTGDGGSMNQPPAFGKSDVGWWNVEHFDPRSSESERLAMVRDAQGHKRTGMGPYAVHEGVPGHHLQLSIARLNPNPLRNVFEDNTLIEGWALYAETMFWEAGGLGPSPEAESNTLRSWRFRIRRVFYGVHVACGDWTLQEAADFRSRARRGRGEVDEDILRAINWPTQLIGYFTGKMQILDLREAYRRKLGAGYSDRKFHDALLAEGSIPVALIRAKLLGEAVPGI